MPVRKRQETQEVLRTMILPPILSAVLLILSYPDFNCGFLAWFGLVPLLYALENTRPLKAFFAAYVCGFIFFLGTIYWLIHVTLPGMIAVSSYLAVYFGLFGLLSSLARSDSEIRSVFIIPSIWVAMEWARSHLLSGFGWALLGHSQSGYLPVIQIADITGAYGVSFIVAMANVTLFLMVKTTLKRDRAIQYISITVFVLFLCFSYGIFRLKNIFTGEKLKVAIVQGNIPQSKKWDSSFRQDIINRYEGLSREAAKSGPDLIIWPETAVPGFLESDKELLDRITSLAADLHTPMLVGTPREDASGTDAYYNSAVLILQDGSVAGSYDKIHLVPFGEYIPMKDMLSFVENYASSPIGDFSAGDEYTVFSYFVRRSSGNNDVNMRLTKKIKFSVLICFEDIFPDIARQFVLRDANFLVNMTNDAWFNVSSAPYQHAQSSVFRAVENRVNVIRAANTGYSCFIDQKGRITDAVESGGKRIFVEGFRAHDIVLTRTRTFYALYGDIFAYACILFAAGAISRTVLKRRRAR